MVSVDIFSPKAATGRLASTADIATATDLQLGEAEMLRGLRNFLNMGRASQH